MEWIALGMVVAFLAIIKRPIIYVLVFVEFFPRIVTSIVAAVFYSSHSSGAKMYEFNYFTSSNTYLSIILMAILATVLCAFYFLSTALNKQIRINQASSPTPNFWERYSTIPLILIFSFLLFEASGVVGRIGSDVSISKQNYMDFVRHPALYKAVHAIFPMFFIMLSIFVIKKLERRERVSRQFWAEIIVAFSLMTILYILLQQKSFIFRTTLLYFGAPLLILLSQKYDVNKFAGILFAVCAVGFYCATAYQYRTVLSFVDVPQAIGGRLLLEGQLNYLNLEQAIGSSKRLDFFDYYGFLADSDSAILHLVGTFGRSDLISRAEIGQWLPSGLMPGFIFRTNIWPIFFPFWLFILFITGKVLLSAYAFIMKGRAFTAFFGIKLAFTIFQFVAQGTNLLSYMPFWVYLAAFVISAKLFRPRGDDRSKAVANGSPSRSFGRGAVGNLQLPLAVNSPGRFAGQGVKRPVRSRR